MLLKMLSLFESPPESTIKNSTCIAPIAKSAKSNHLFITQSDENNLIKYCRYLINHGHNFSPPRS